MLGIGLIFKQDKFIGYKLQAFAAQFAILKKFLNYLAGHLKFPMAGKKLIKIDLLLFKIHDINAQGIGLKPGIDVFGNKNHLFTLVKQSIGHGQDAVISHIQIKTGVFHITTVSENLENPAIVHFHPIGKSAPLPQMIKLTDNPPGIAAQFIVAGLEAVKFLDNCHGQDNNVIGKGLDGIGVMKQDIGINNKIFSHLYLRRNGAKTARIRREALK